jgi:hypothetical protein
MGELSFAMVDLLIFFFLAEKDETLNGRILNSQRTF